MSWISQNIGWPAILIFFGSLLTITGGIWATIEKNISEKELSQTTQKIKDTLISTDSYCYLLPANIKLNPDSLEFILLQNGDNPIYDLHIQIALLEEHNAFRLEQGPNNIEDEQRLDLNLDIGNVGIDKVITLGGRTLPDYPKYTFDIYYEHLHGRFMQIIELYRIDTEIKYRSIVKPYGPGDTIYYEYGNISQNEIDNLNI